ncbi:hypothetical protein [Clostridium isatidis]|uniref:hypothetical protein n=1 Tax=Clostridium isatidis TaxID=182773 RepID=UPI003AAFE7C2
MSYKPIKFKDRIIEKPNTFKSTENSDGTITLIPEPGQVLQEGTPLNAANFNHLENGIIEVNAQLANIVTDLQLIDGVDNTIAIQNGLNNKGWVRITKPGTYLISSSLVIDSNTKFELYDGVTIKLKSGTSKYMLINKDQINGNENIEVNGGTWDVDGNNNPATGIYPTGYPGHAIFFNKVKNIKYKNITVKNAKKYAFLTVECDGFIADNINFNTFSDGLHFQPPLKNANIRNVSGTTGDDMIAFTLGDYQNYLVSGIGDFEKITVDGVYAKNAKSVIKITGSGTNNDNIFKHMSFNNINGTVEKEGISIINDSSGGNGTLLKTVCKCLNFKNISIDGGSNASVFISANSADINFDNICFNNKLHFYCNAKDNLNLNINNVNSDFTIEDSFVKNFGILTNLNLSNVKLQFGTTGKVYNQSTGIYKNIAFNNVEFAGDTKSSQYVFYFNNNTQEINSVFVNNGKFENLGSFAYIKGGALFKINNCFQKNITTIFNFQPNSNVRIESNNSNLDGVYFSDDTPVVSISGICFNYKKLLKQLTPRENDILISSATSETNKGLLFYNGTDWIKIA